MNVTSTIANFITNTSNEERNWRNRWGTFCTRDTDEICSDIPLSQCPTCSQYGIWIFFFFALLLGLWIQIGNLLVIIFLRRNMSNWSIIRISLAISDMLVGGLLLFSLLPNIVLTYHATAFEIYVEAEKKINSPVATFLAMYFLCSIASFMFHLTFMSYYRYSALKWPIKTLNQSHWNPILKLVLVWVLALIAASYPTWFPGSYEFLYVTYAYLYLPNISVRNSTDFAIATGTLIPFALSYILMTIFTVMTGFLIRRISSNRRQLNATGNNASTERNPFVLLILLEIVFTISALPAIVGYAFTHASKGNSIVLLVANYVLMANGAINLIIYWKQDKNFKAFIKNFKLSMIFNRS